MNDTEIPILTVTLKLGAAVPAGRFVTGAGALPAAGARALGVTYLGGAAADKVPVRTLGVVRVTAGAAVAAGAAVQSAADGRAEPLGGGKVCAGVALSASSAAGQDITVHLTP